jgi:hypothetical protein
MSMLRVLTMLAITVGSAQAAVLAQPHSSARLPGLGRVASAAFAEAATPTGRAHGIPESCPYHFGSDMPAATFCVYQGVAFGGGGEVCATDVVAIWSNLASPAPVSAGPAEKASGSNREVYLAFVADPELVLRAIVDARQDDRAEVVGYTLGGDEVLQPLAGKMTLRAGSGGRADVLSMALRKRQRFHRGSCAFASYSGTFLGMLRSAVETTSSIDAFRVPEQ